MPIISLLDEYHKTQTQMHLFGRKYKTYNFLDVHKHKTI